MTFEENREKYGDIILGSDAYVTDPCYSPDLWCCNKVSVRPGKWQTAISRNDSDAIACLGVYHEAYDENRVSWEGAPFLVGVDSGQAGVFDAEFFERNHGGEYNDPSSFYGECCAITLSRLGFGALQCEKGFVSTSGYGDGGYDLRIGRNDAGEAVALEVIFISDDDDEDDWDDDEDDEEEFED